MEALDLNFGELYQRLGHFLLNYIHNNPVSPLYEVPLDQIVSL